MSPPPPIICGPPMVMLPKPIVSLGFETGYCYSGGANSSSRLKSLSIASAAAFKFEPLLPNVAPYDKPSLMS